MNNNNELLPPEIPEEVPSADSDSTVPSETVPNTNPMDSTQATSNPLPQTTAGNPATAGRTRRFRDSWRDLGKGWRGLVIALLLLALAGGGIGIYSAVNGPRHPDRSSSFQRGSAWHGNDNEQKPANGKSDRRKGDHVRGQRDPNRATKPSSPDAGSPTIAPSQPAPSATPNPTETPHK